MSGARVDRGFTLLEVLVALVIVAFGMGALMATLTSAATSVERLRDRSFAEWVALNRISEVRLGKSAPTKGKTSGETQMGGQKWQWTQEIDDANFPSMLRIDVRVSRQGAKASESIELASAQGFLGLAGTLSRNTGTYTDADWSMTAAIANARQQSDTSNGGGATGTPSGGTPGTTTTPPAQTPPAPAPAPLANPASTR